MQLIYPKHIFLKDSILAIYKLIRRRKYVENSKLEISGLEEFTGAYLSHITIISVNKFVMTAA